MYTHVHKQLGDDGHTCDARWGRGGSGRAFYRIRIWQLQHGLISQLELADDARPPIVVDSIRKLSRKESGRPGGVKMIGTSTDPNDQTYSVHRHVLRKRHSGAGGRNACKDTQTNAQWTFRGTNNGSDGGAVGNNGGGSWWCKEKTH